MSDRCKAVNESRKQLNFIQIAIRDLAVNDPTSNRNVLRSKITVHVMSDKSDRNIVDSVAF